VRDGTEQRDREQTVDDQQDGKQAAPSIRERKAVNPPAGSA